MKSKKTSKKSFADDFSALERIVQSFETKNLNLDDSLEAFEKGLQIAERLKKTLEGVENKMIALKKKYHIDA